MLSLIAENVFQREKGVFELFVGSRSSSPKFSLHLLASLDLRHKLTLESRNIRVQVNKLCQACAGCEF